jgi:hypothetical protein
MSSSECSSSEWYRQRNAAQVILSCYHKSIVESLPDMVLYFLRHINTPRKNVFILEIAKKIDVLIAGNKDPITRKTVFFPMGVDVVLVCLAATLIDSFGDVSDLCEKSEIVLREMKRHRGLRKRAEGKDDEFSSNAMPFLLDTEIHKQVVLPMVFGAKHAIAARDVKELNLCFPRDETQCMKLISAFSAKPITDVESTFEISFHPLAMTEQILYERLCNVVNFSPGLLLKALSELGYMGPYFFTHRMFLPEGATYPFGSLSLPLAYAEWLQSQVECNAMLR